MELVFSRDYILNKKVHKFMKNEFSTGNFLGLWSKGPYCNFTGKTIFLAQLRKAAADHLFDKHDQTIRKVKNQILTHQIPKEKLKPRLVKWLACFFKWL